MATDASENTRRRRIEERIVQKSVEKEVLEEQVKREQDIARQKEDLEELLRQYRSRLFDEEDLQDFKQLSQFKDPETRKFPANNGAESRSTPSLGKDMWHQLKRFSIPVFSGDKRLYEGWKTAFMACVDKAPATPEYKLLQLRQYLSGEALKVVEPLGHSAAAYETAKERLERKFGGKRLQIALHLDRSCIRSKIRGINNCKNTHNRLLHRDSVPADQSEQVNTHDRREMEQGASGGSQAVAESETSNETSLTPPQYPVEQATERSHATVTSQSAQPRFVALRTDQCF